MDFNSKSVSHAIPLRGLQLPRYVMLLPGDKEMRRLSFSVCMPLWERCYDVTTEACECFGSWKQPVNDMLRVDRFNVPRTN